MLVGAVVCDAWRVMEPLGGKPGFVMDPTLITYSKINIRPFAGLGYDILVIHNLCLLSYIGDYCYCITRRSEKPHVITVIGYSVGAYTCAVQ